MDSPTSANDSYQKLLAQYTEIARLAGALAHEIKNPLSTIRLNMDLLAEDLEEAQSPAQRRAAKRINSMKRECQRLQDLLDDFLNFAKVRRLNLQSTDLNQEIDEALDFFAPEAEAAGVEMLDAESFRAALVNLLLNAKQAMADGGQLVVRTTFTGQTVALQLIDNGCGIDD
jgi:signal transduction histidine kinase